VHWRTRGRVTDVQKLILKLETGAFTFAFISVLDTVWVPSIRYEKSGWDVKFVAARIGILLFTSV
jgi:hypothetical protein